jgi:GNAT superfamily N-acetyltransferase
MSRDLRTVIDDGVVTSGDAVTVRSLQERAARALPAEHVEYVGDWWLRRSASSSWWRGTVLPHGDTDRDELLRRIEAAERFYARFGTAARFQVCPGACADELDATLSERGYRRSGPMSLRAAPVAAIQALAGAVGSGIRLTEAPTDEWLDVWSAGQGRGSDPQAERDMLDRVPRPSAYASVVHESAVVAVGRAVADSAWVGVFNMATLPAARGRGAAHEVLAALADWAAARDAVGMYLQVERDNAPALRLYERAGFAELRSYHYRTQPD